MKNDCFEGSNVIFFTFFVNFWGTKLKPFSGKANQSLQNGFILRFARGSILEIGFEATLKSKTNVLSFRKRSFWFFFVHFSVNKLKMFLGKAKQSIQNCVNQKSDIENILENFSKFYFLWKCSRERERDVSILTILHLLFEFPIWRCLYYYSQF